MNEPAVMTIELKSHFLRLYEMALSDENFDVLELQMLYYLAEQRGILKDELDKLFLNPIYDESNIPEELHVRIAYLYDLTCVMWADGKITEDEINTLKKYCRKFEFLDENIDDLANYLISCVQNGVDKNEIIKQLNS